MPKPTPPDSHKNVAAPDEDENAQVRQLCELAGQLAGPAPAEALDALQRAIRKCLQRKQDDVLYEALEESRDTDINVYRQLKEVMDEAAAVAVIRRGQVVDEINAFVIPVFARTMGGLDAERCCADQDAFDGLLASMREAGLESPHAEIVLINHAYHLDEIDSITYSHLSEMVREAHASMTDRKAIAAPAIERSFGVWPANPFQPGDEAVELRFLLGFALKLQDDPFYLVPEDEAAMDEYFAARAERFRQWSDAAAPLVKRLMVQDAVDGGIDVHFLYQDLFHGGKERGIAEYFMLQMMSTLSQALEESACAPAAARAVIGPAIARDEDILRVNLYRGDSDVPLVAAEKPLGPERDAEMEIDDVCDALATMGIVLLQVAAGFDEAGRPLEVRPYA